MRGRITQLLGGDGWGFIRGEDGCEVFFDGFDIPRKQFTLALLLMLRGEDRLFDPDLVTDIIALPPSWPNLWVVMKIVERWQRYSVSSSQKARRVFRRLDIVSWAANSCKAASGRIGKEIRAVKDRTGRLIP